MTRWFITAGLLLRLYLIATTSTGADIANFTDSARYFAEGRNIFEVQWFYNYSPALGLLIAPLANTPDYALAHRLMLTAFDAINTALLWRLAGKWTALAYWCGATAFLIASHGQFELLAMTPLLLACWCLRRASSHCSSSTLLRRSS